MLWPVNMRLIISYCHDMILSAGCSKDDCVNGALWPVNMKLFISNCHAVILWRVVRKMIVTVEALWPMDLRLFISYCLDVILSAGCSIDDRDSGSLMAYEFGIVYELLLCRDSFGGLFGR